MRLLRAKSNFLLADGNHCQKPINDFLPVTAAAMAGFLFYMPTLMRAKVFIVDGHSAIFTSESLADLHRQSGELARTELIRALRWFHDMSDYAVVVVFDGKSGGDLPASTTGEDIMVVFSQGGASADAVIERMAARHSEKYEVFVASNDRGVLDAISASGAFPMSIRAMWELIDRV